MGLWVMGIVWLGIGAAIAWIVARSRSRAELARAEALAAQTATQAQVELAGANMRASRIPVLEQNLTETTATLNRVNAENATLEEQVRQISALQGRLNVAETGLAAATQTISDLREQAGKINAELTGARETVASLRADIGTLTGHYEAKVQEASSLALDLADVRHKLATEIEASQEKLALLADAKQALSDQFKNLANEILEDKSKRFTEQNQTNLGALLDPLKLRITEFQSKIEDTYVKEGKERTALGEQVRQLMELNNQLSEDAKNLTRALRGSSKTQGNWGELVLERVLEASGLRKGEEYVVQTSHTREDGTRALPDVVIRLPDSRSLVVDAKVSLVAYEEFAVSEVELDRVAASKRHIESVKNHIRGLSEKNYHALYGLKSLDFVLLFVPIEPAFMLAVTSDRDIFMDAWKRNVLLVSPSTLLFVVRTVAHLWRQEAQTRNAQEIAKRGAELYDKFVGFVEDMTALGNRLRQAQTEYEGAYGKLAGGRGHLIGQAEKLRALGVKPSKSLPPAMQENALNDDITTDTPLVGTAQVASA
ncbi:MAG: DNA recombination protein RmuC [Pseudomonadota bacterium]|nr:DNA recombination protein RmuC [Pseudomonadota bacterium]